MSTISGLLKAGAVVIALTFSAVTALPVSADGCRGRCQSGVGSANRAGVSKCNEGWEYNKKKGICERKQPNDNAG